MEREPEAAPGRPGDGDAASCWTRRVFRHLGAHQGVSVRLTRQTSEAVQLQVPGTKKQIGNIGCEGDFNKDGAGSTVDAATLLTAILTAMRVGNERLSLRQCLSLALMAWGSPDGGWRQLGTPLQGSRGASRPLWVVGLPPQPLGADTEVSPCAHGA